MSNRTYPVKTSPADRVMLERFPPLTEQHERLLMSTPWDQIPATFARIGFRRPRRWFEAYRRALQATNPEVKVNVEEEREINRLRGEVSAMKVRYRKVLTELDEAKAQLDVADVLDAVGPGALPTVARESSKAPHESTVLNVFGDWHMGETIESRHTGGYNKFNPEVAELSVARVTESAIRMALIQSSHRPVSTFVAAYLGDLINGELHGSKATNSHPLVEQAEWTQALLMAQIDRFIDAMDGKRIILVFTPGNHGRLTDKLEYARLNGMSLESMIYRAVAARYADVDNVECLLSESESVTLDVYGERLRFRHGMEINYRGGRGRYVLPAYSMIDKWNANEPCDCEIFGHLHTYGAPPNFISTGSLCGFNARARAKGYTRQPPLQAWAAWDSHHGRTFTAPLIVR